jgi:predicted GIY-YIG superfamily endonuclease
MELANGGVYIGISTSPHRRFREHQDGYASDVRVKFGEPAYMTTLVRFSTFRAARAAEKEFQLALGQKICRG